MSVTLAIVEMEALVSAQEWPPAPVLLVIKVTGARLYLRWTGARGSPVPPTVSAWYQEKLLSAPVFQASLDNLKQAASR